MSDGGEEDDIVTLKEAVEDDKTREEDAIAVLGAADENNCTYHQGYLERQAVFYCTTCDPLKNSPAGVCYACAVNCHRSHELIELYTKRHFRCDCGNSKFDGFKCNLEEEKDPLNKLNNYNHNFVGNYCTCDRPYPDPEDEIEDVMIQCIVCEDWFHSRHLGALEPASYSEMICDTCVQKHDFLQYYKDLEVPPLALVTITKDDSKKDVDVVNTDPTAETIGGCKRKLDDSAPQPFPTCKLDELKEKYQPSEVQSVVKFLEEDWRSKLCRCSKCLSMYADQSVGYLLNTADTIQCYEEKGKQNVEKVFEEAATTISNLGQLQHVELLQGFHELKSGMHEFFGKFPEGHVVSTDDVKGFFENLQKNKKRRLDGLPLVN